MDRVTQLLLVVMSIAITNLVDAQKDRIQLRTKMCAPLTLTQCEREARMCLDLSLRLREAFVSFTSVVACANQNGIGLFALGSAYSSSKTNAEIVRDAGADAQTARAMTRCVLTNLGYATNNVLNVGRIKNTMVPIIRENIRKPAQQAATLAALNRCRQPNIDTMRAFILCISKTCIEGR